MAIYHKPSATPLPPHRPQKSLTIILDQNSHRAAQGACGCQPASNEILNHRKIPGVGQNYPGGQGAVVGEFGRGEFLHIHQGERDRRDLSVRSDVIIRPGRSILPSKNAALPGRIPGCPLVSGGYLGPRPPENCRWWAPGSERSSHPWPVAISRRRPGAPSVMSRKYVTKLRSS